MDVKFYHCERCGNIATKPFDGGVPLVCCGEEMKELTENTEDASLEKHVPEVTVSEGKVHVEVGSVLHPMVKEHFIAFICLATEKAYQIAILKPGDEPKADFALCEDDTPYKVYEYCNLHGLWVTKL